MVKETAIKVSKAFKEFLNDKKQKGEDFETTIKRLITKVNQVNSKELTVKREFFINKVTPEMFNFENKKKKIKIFNNLTDFNLHVLNKQMNN